MARQRGIDHASIHENHIARQVEFTAEIDGDEVGVAVKMRFLRNRVAMRVDISQL